MANHIQSLKDSTIPQVTKDEFWASLREGDFLFCSGVEAISHAIEHATGSPWSHVAMVLKVSTASGITEWCVLEAVWPHGVTITPIWQYIDRYQGDLVLCKRVVDGVDMDQAAAITRGFSLIGRDYAVVGLVKEGLHRICSKLPPEMNNTECYCSGLQGLMSEATPYPFPSPKGGAPTPEDEFTDITMVPVCALMFEAAHAATA